jgi:hypothetical protein
LFLPRSPSPRKSPIPLDLRARWTQESGSKKIGICVLPWCHQPKPLPVGVTGRNIEDTQPLPPHSHPKHPKAAPQPPTPTHTRPNTPHRASSPALTEPATECTSHDPKLCERWLHQTLRASCTIGPHDASAPPTTPAYVRESHLREHQTPRTSESRTDQCTTPVSAEQKQKSSSQGPHSLGQAKEAHISTERETAIFIAGPSALSRKQREPRAGEAI